MCTCLGWSLKQLVEVRVSSLGDDADSTSAPKASLTSTSKRIKISNDLIPPFAAQLWRRTFIPALERAAGALENPWLNGDGDEAILLNLIAAIAKIIWPRATYKVTFNSGLYLVVSAPLSSREQHISLIFIPRRGSASTSGVDVSSLLPSM